MKPGVASTLRWAALGASLIGLLLVLRNSVVERPLERLARGDATAGDGAVQWSGSWQLPRGGPYILGFDSGREPASLTVGPHTIAGTGLVTRRLVYDASVQAVSYRGPASATLLWHPPGRRGPPEYVPPSSLSSATPEAAHFGSGAGRSVLDGVIALAILGVILGCLVGRGRRRIATSLREHRQLWLAFVALFVVALVIRLVDLGGAGQTWDEDVNWSAGRNYLTNLLSLDFRSAAWQWNYEHPPVMKYLAGIGAQFADGYGPSRAISALLGALAVAFLVPIGARLHSYRAGVFAAVIACFTPHLIAHSKVVGHESPTLLWWTLAVWLALRIWDGAPTRRLLVRRLGWLGLVLGVAVASRFVNVLLAPLLGCLLLLGAPRGRRKEILWLGATVLPVAAAVIFYLLWPRLWLDPIGALSSSWAKLKNPHSAEPYLGVITNQPPRHYFIVYLAATAPLGCLLGVGLWLARIVIRPAARRPALMLALLLAAPLVVTLSPVRQDGVRYIMPSLVALALMAGSGFAWLAEALARLMARGAAGDAAAVAATAAAARRSRRLYGATLVVVAGYLALTCARIHPYYLDYYGEQVGGPRRVAAGKLFEVAWWGEGLADAIAYVNRHAAAGARVHRGCVEPGHLTWFRGDLWHNEAQRTEEADWVIHYQPSWRSCAIGPGLRLVHEVLAAGAPLVRVYERREASPQPQSQP